MALASPAISLTATDRTNSLSIAKFRMNPTPHLDHGQPRVTTLHPENILAPDDADDP